MNPRATWRNIIAAGSHMPVSDTERARHQRVQATLRAIYGLTPDATDDQLIDARTGDTRTPAELAALYLADYANRLDPTSTLEPVDDAALPWRGTQPPPTTEPVADPLFSDAWLQFCKSIP